MVAIVGRSYTAHKLSVGLLLLAQQFLYCNVAEATNQLGLVSLSGKLSNLGDFLSTRALSEEDVPQIHWEPPEGWRLDKLQALVPTKSGAYRIYATMTNQRTKTTAVKILRTEINGTSVKPGFEAIDPALDIAQNVAPVHIFPSKNIQRPRRIAFFMTTNGVSRLYFYDIDDEGLPILNTRTYAEIESASPNEVVGTVLYDGLDDKDRPLGIAFQLHKNCVIHIFGTNADESVFKVGLPPSRQLADAGGNPYTGCHSLSLTPTWPSRMLITRENASPIVVRAYISYVAKTNGGVYQVFVKYEPEKDIVTLGGTATKDFLAAAYGEGNWIGFHLLQTVVPPNVAVESSPQNIISLPNIIVLEDANITLSSSGKKATNVSGPVLQRYMPFSVKSRLNSTWATRAIPGVVPLEDLGECKFAYLEDFASDAFLLSVYPESTNPQESGLVIKFFPFELSRDNDSILEEDDRTAAYDRIVGVADTSSITTEGDGAHDVKVSSSTEQAAISHAGDNDEFLPQSRRRALGERTETGLLHEGAVAAEPILTLRYKFNIGTKGAIGFDDGAEVITPKDTAGQQKIDILIDHSSVEVFADGAGVAATYYSPVKKPSLARVCFQSTGTVPVTFGYRSRYSPFTLRSTSGSVRTTATGAALLFAVAAIALVF